VATQELLDAIDDEGPVWESRESVMARLEGDLFLLDHEGLMQMLAFHLKCFGHAHEGDSQAPLEHRKGLGQPVLDAQSPGVTVEL
jgi:hypothetical protein